VIGGGDAGRRVAAVIAREMRALARYRTPFVLRTVYAVLISTPVASFVADFGDQTRWTGEQMAYFGYQTFGILVWFQCFLAVALGILMGVVSVSVERRERTLGLVMLSQVRPRELILGKLTALLALLSTVLLAGLPVYALVGWAGGLDYFWFACLVLLSAMLATLGIVAGLAASVALRNGFAAVLGAGVLVVAPIVFGLIWHQALASGQPDLPSRLLASVGWLTASVAQQDADDGLFWSAIDVLAISAMIAALFGIAVRRLPRAASAREGSGLRGAFEKLDRFYESINVGGIRFGRDRRSLTGDPVSWLTRTTSGTALMRYGFRIAAVATILSLVSVPWLLFEGSQELIWFLFGAGLVVAMLSLGAGSLGDEKARRSLGVLLATPLTAAQILHGKMRAALPVLLAAMVPAAVFLVFGPLVEPRGLSDLVQGIAFVLAEGLCGFFLAMHVSLHVSTSLRAGIAGALALMAVHVAFAWAASKAGSGDGAVVTLFALVAAGVGVWASQYRRPMARFAALLVVAVSVHGLLLRWLEMLDFDLLGEPVFAVLLTLLLTVAATSYVHARLVFDQVLGRTP
jgi:ABC-type transport system involved in multi-copper enzyme maturation permease subunit